MSSKIYDILELSADFFDYFHKKYSILYCKIFFSPKFAQSYHACIFAVKAPSDKYFCRGICEKREDIRDKKTSEKNFCGVFCAELISASGERRGAGRI